MFGIPVAAVASAFFFHYFGRAGDKPAVATRAALRLAERERRAVRVPRAPRTAARRHTRKTPLEVTPRPGTGAPAATASASEAPPRPSTSTELAMSERTASAEAIAGRPDLSADHS